MLVSRVALRRVSFITSMPGQASISSIFNVLSALSLTGGGGCQLFRRQAAQLGRQTTQRMSESEGERVDYGGKSCGVGGSADGM